MNDSAMTQPSPDPEHTPALTTSPSPKADNWRSPTMLSQAEIESLRQETKDAHVQIKAYLKRLREMKAAR